MDIQIHKAFRTPNRHDHKRTSAYHMIVEMPRGQNKEKNIKNFKKEESSYIQK
jgi:hypothetical protein